MLWKKKKKEKWHARVFLELFETHLFVCADQSDHFLKTSVGSVKIHMEVESQKEIQSLNLRPNSFIKDCKFRCIQKNIESNIFQVQPIQKATVGQKMSYRSERLGTWVSFEYLPKNHIFPFCWNIDNEKEKNYLRTSIAGLCRLDLLLHLVSNSEGGGNVGGAWADLSASEPLALWLLGSIWYRTSSLTTWRGRVAGNVKKGKINSEGSKFDSVKCSTWSLGFCVWSWYVARFSLIQSKKQAQICIVTEEHLITWQACII